MRKRMVGFWERVKERFTRTEKEEQERADERWKRRYKKDLETRTTKSRKFLGVSVVVPPGHKGGYPWAQFDEEDGGSNMVAVHTTRDKLGLREVHDDVREGEEDEEQEGGEKVPALFYAFTPSYPELQLQVTTGTVDNRALEAHFDNLKGDANQELGNVLDGILKWAGGNGRSEGWQRWLTIEGPRKAIEQGQGLGGKIINFFQAGSVIKSALRGVSLDFSELDRDSVTLDWHHEAYALDGPMPEFYADYWYYQGKAYGVWEVSRLTTSALRKILKVKGDFKFRIKYLDPRSDNPKMYLAMLIKIGVPIKEVGKLGEIGEELADIQGVNITRVERTPRFRKEMELAFKCFVVGGRMIPARWGMHSIHRREQDGILQAIAECVTELGDPNGDVPLGLQTGVQKGKVYKVDQYNHGTFSLEGHQKMGKSLWEAVLAASMCGERIIWFPFRWNKADSVFSWVRLFGGPEPFPLDLRDAKDLAQDAIDRGEDAPDPRKHPEEIEKWQRELHEGNLDRAVNFWSWVLAKLRLDGKFPGPITFEGKITLCALDFFRCIMRVGLDMHEEVFLQTGEYSAMCVDNMSAMWRYARAGGFYERAVLRLGDTIEDVVGNGANVGLRFLVNTHSDPKKPSDYDRISVGLAGKFSVRYKMASSEYKLAKVTLRDEYSGDFKALRLNIRLTDYPEILSVFERKEPEIQRGPEKPVFSTSLAEETV